MVYGVSRIALPSCDLGTTLRTDRSFGHRSADFLVGPENRLAVPVLQRLLEPEDTPSTQSELFNPLVLLGPTGMGKSHLARGITRHWVSTYGESAVEYVTAADFARQLRAARDEGVLEKFRSRFTRLQLLVVEDLHRLPPRVFVQREFRDTFDVLMDAGAAVVITTQQPPATMPELEAGLRDRLLGGLTIRLQNPGIEVRIELLRLAANERGVQIDDEQLQQLARKVDGPAPQLFRAIAEFELDRKNLASAQALSSEALPSVGIGRSPLKFKQILAVVARYFSVTQAALCSPARRKSLVYARGVAIHLARSLTDLSYAQIGQALGRRDHTTVMHSSRSIEKRLGSDATTQQDIEELQRILTAV